ncbi:hypothetical protein PROFUN_12518 [Planoprotostelium fungivorum]|uniref:Uncharacterized protein n=1 Tax=Planoprotostelium fungivorum TaxID=1890364 RepID=A0A2P6MS33_9EUKA|nr:hypothetical protein PROFUN_12518 [Planoprotostelium fungivorum]
MSEYSMECGTRRTIPALRHIHGSVIISSLFSTEERTRELESIIALKSRQPVYRKKSRVSGGCLRTISNFLTATFGVGTAFFVADAPSRVITEWGLRPHPLQRDHPCRSPPCLERALSFLSSALTGDSTVCPCQRTLLNHMDPRKKVSNDPNLPIRDQFDIQYVRGATVFQKNHAESSWETESTTTRRGTKKMSTDFDLFVGRRPKDNNFKIIK